MIRLKSLSPLATALLALNLALILACSAIITFTPAPRIDTAFGGATVAIAADRSWTLLPGQCATISWDLEGIQSVYVNGKGKIGRDELMFCPTRGVTSVEFAITAGNGDLQTFLLNINDLTSYTLSWLPMWGLLLPLILALWYLATMRLSDPVRPGYAQFLALAALLLLGLLLHTAEPALLPKALNLFESITQSRAWHLLGSALAAMVFVPLAIQMLRSKSVSAMRADLVAIGAFFVVMLLLYSQAGFESIGQWESWPMQALFEGRSSKAEAELVSRFWIVVPHVLAAAISWHSFVGYHVVNFLMFWGMLALLYGILRQLRVTPWLAFLATMLFLTYPVNSHLMSLRSVPMTFTKLSLLAAVFLVLDCRFNCSRLRLLGIWLALLFNLGSYETGFVIILIAPMLWWRRDAGRLWQNVNLTVIWYLVPAAKVTQLLLLYVSGISFYGGWYWAFATTGNDHILEFLNRHLNIVANAYFQTFVNGWQEALSAISQDTWMLPTVTTLLMIGLTSYYFSRQAGQDTIPSRPAVIVALLSGLAFILPAIGVVMWVPVRAYGLWRMYVYVPIGAAVAMLALVIIASSLVKGSQARRYVIIVVCVLLMYPGLSRLYVQQGRFVESANAKAHVIMQIVEQAPAFWADARLMLFTSMSSDELRQRGIKELDTNMLDSAFYMLYQTGRPEIAFFCIHDEQCGSSDININSNFLATADDFSDIVMFRLHEDLRVELLLELPSELSDRAKAGYDPLRLIDASAPIPPRAQTMLRPALQSQ